mmetsp:Transcript_31205/g.74083  ORF Transcript_31205/g.74083 Transcript_31205/m.74083 type:complete len:229 (+) Transcript_31205:318-1004(+)
MRLVRDGQRECRDHRLAVGARGGEALGRAGERQEGERGGVAARLAEHRADGAVHLVGLRLVLAVKAAKEAGEVRCGHLDARGADVAARLDEGGLRDEECGRAFERRATDGVVEHGRRAHRDRFAVRAPAENHDRELVHAGSLGRDPPEHQHLPQEGVVVRLDAPHHRRCDLVRLHLQRERRPPAHGGGPHHCAGRELLRRLCGLCDRVGRGGLVVGDGGAIMHAEGLR